jgi:hypothetical protein
MECLRSEGAPQDQRAHPLAVHRAHSTVLRTWPRSGSPKAGKPDEHQAGAARFHARANPHQRHRGRPAVAQVTANADLREPGLLKLVAEDQLAEGADSRRPPVLASPNDMGCPGLEKCRTQGPWTAWLSSGHCEWRGPSGISGSSLLVSPTPVAIRAQGLSSSSQTLERSDESVKGFNRSSTPSRPRA